MDAKKAFKLLRRLRTEISDYKLSKQAHVPLGTFRVFADGSEFVSVPVKSISPEEIFPFFPIFLSKLLSTVGVKPGVCEVR